MKYDLPFMRCHICLVMFWFCMTELFHFHPFLGAFAKLQRATFSVVMSGHLSAWNDSAPTGQSFMKFDI
jgi:hypothetical protein